MTLTTYQIFSMVAQTGSFHKAADILGLTPSAISHAMTAMEQELGFAVLNRRKNGITLTTQGDEILKYVHTVLNADESLNQTVAELNGLRRGKVRLGVFSSVCTNWLPDILKSFKAKYEDIEVEIFQGTYADVREWIKNGIVDLGFLSVSSAGDIPIKALYFDPLVCVVPKGTYPKSKKYMGVEDMKGHEFVTQRDCTDADIQNFLKENNLKVQSMYHVVDDLSTVALVEKGFGICLMPSLVMNDIPYDVETYKIKPEAGRIIGIATQNPDFMPPAVRTMYKHILENCGSDT